MSAHAPAKELLPRIVRRSSPISGWGVYAAEAIKEDAFIVEYKGQLISQAEAWRREQRYLPRHRIPWRMTLVAAVFTSLAWELIKGLFAMYVLHATSWQKVYGAFVTPVIIVLWIYYSAVVFVLGGEVAHVYELLRVKRLQRELVE